MKKLLILSNLVWLLLVATYFYINSSAISLDYNGKSFNSLKISTAELLANNYSKNYLPLINNQLKNDDAKSIWFSLDDMKNFVWQIEYHSLNAGIKVDAKDLGIRIYYAQYPSIKELQENTTLNDLNKEFANRHTLFLVPTIKQSDKNMDFDPRANYKAIKGGTQKEFKTYFQEKGPYAFIQDDNGTTIMNHGGLCPPGCPTN